MTRAPQYGRPRVPALTAAQHRAEVATLQGYIRDERRKPYTNARAHRDSCEAIREFNRQIGVHEDAARKLEAEARMVEAAFGERA